VERFFRRFPIHFVRKFRQMTFGAAILGTAVSVATR